MKDRISIYSATNAYTHKRDPKSIAVTIELISGGGGGMGSRPDMSFTNRADAYALYGGKGGMVCFDVRDPIQAHTNGGLIFTCPNHGLADDHPVYFSYDTNAKDNYYVYAPTKTRDSFQLSKYPYTAPGVTTPYTPFQFDNVNYTWTIIPWKYALLGGNGGGVIGDQAIAGQVIGFYFGDTPYPSSWYEYGSCGQNILCGGGPGGSSPIGGGAACQIGGLIGNYGTDQQGGGGSGAGLALYPPMPGAIIQWGPGGGAGGNRGIIHADLKDEYKIYSGNYGLAGKAGPGGFEGGRGGYPLVKITERFV